MEQSRLEEIQAILAQRELPATTVIPVAGKKKTAKVKSVESDKGLDAIAQAMQDFPEKLKDSKFLTAYAHSRIAARNKREADKEEKEKINKILTKYKEAEKIKEKQGELLYQVKSKDFHYKFWMLPNGKIFKEIIARPGLKIGK